MEQKTPSDALDFNLSKYPCCLTMEALLCHGRSAGILLTSRSLARLRLAAGHAMNHTNKR
jgi:hypothetical protein